ncbi:MAG: rhomboid family intramembrane serine protease [Rikenellaceae bacterium]
MRLEFKTVVSNLIMLNIVAMVFINFIPQSLPFIDKYLALYPFEHNNFKFFQLVSYMFLHADFTHLFFNMFALWMFGRQLEYDLGSKRFLSYYLLTGIGAGALNLLVMSLTGDYGITIGASGAVYGILLAFGVLHPNVPLYLFFLPIPIKAKWFVIGYGVLELLQGLASNDNVAHFAHLGGMVFGLALLLIWKKVRLGNRPRF